MSNVFRLTAGFFGTVFIAFGINAIQNPENALSYFELQYPSSTLPVSTSRYSPVDVLLAVYGVRDIFMGLVIYITAYFGNQKTLGLVILAAAAVALGDGAVCMFMVRQGQWNHWGYAPVLVTLGGIILND